MLYDAYQAQWDVLAPVRAWAGLTSSIFRETCAGPTSNYIFKSISAAAEIVNRAHLIHDRPDRFGGLLSDALAAISEVPRGGVRKR